MKLFKKLASFILAFAMVMAIAMPSVVMAADGKSTITVDGATAGSEYVAYKLFNATDDGNGHFSYTVNSKYETVLKEVTGKSTGAEIVKHLDGIKDNAAAVREFADKVYAKVKDMAVDYTATNGKFVNVDQGYYLIAQTQTGTNEAYSLVMLDTAGKNNLTVTPKTGVPTFEKKIKEKNDSTGVESGWQDASDYDIGDEVPFKLTGTVSDKYDNYKTYYYAFHDKMDDTLEFNADSVVVKIDGKEVAKEKYTLNTKTTDGCTFEVVFNDLKTVSPTKPENVTVEYTATLKDTAKLGSVGNFNKGKLEFNNNPYYEGEGKPEKPGETPWDEVVVFTYKLIANKTDGQGKALPGAGFTLYKFDKDTNDYVKVKEIPAGETTTFEFTGADAGKYKLVETTVPDGYNKADDLVFEVKGTYEAVNNADPFKAPTLTKLEILDGNGNSITGENKVFTTNLKQGTATTNIKNLTGSALPSTGGMGTTVLYAAGTLMILAAAAFLVMKKKAESK
ncbi:isopeptide-forming domain-containing fimbrial protein [uncultured Catenibacterium sp.]|mgnify:CR=1 FL=1|uniref:isopeptide-forming domain-containing fimbrial protein n=1 Tax=uncultured Catenibacterium sp. TaxID=286142 RepID=UPI002598A688|nr:isopeptide-forming domain-containing fimbrial protein [uncultured Catenibacterium sp.]